MILYNGKVYSNNTFYTAIVIDGKKIAYIGNDTDALKYSEYLKNKECIDLEGKLVLPGFIDSHAHGGSFLAMAKDKIDLYEYRNIDDYLRVIKDFIRQNPNTEFYKGVGWSSPLFEKSGPDKKLLDNICSEKPIVIKSAEGHSVWANSKAIELAGVTSETPDPQGGVIARNQDGSVRGAFHDEAQNYIDAIVPDDPVELYKEAIIEYQQMMVKYGYTATTEMMMVKGSNLHKAYRELAEEGQLLIKTELTHMVTPADAADVTEILKDHEIVFKDKLADGYHAKIFIDGVIESATAWLKEPYSNNPDFYGEHLWDDEVLFKTCIELDKLGYDIHFHVIGDRAVSQMIDAMEAVEKANGKRERRTVAAHVQLMDPADISRMKAVGISVSSNPYWFFKDAVYTQMNEIPMLGERVDEQFPMKSLADNDIVISVGSDFAITAEPNPIMAIKFGMERVAYDADIMDKESSLNIKERVDFDTMLKGVTINGAYTLGIDEYTGSLQVGKLADIVVLDRDIFTIPTSEYINTNVEMTISEGQVVYSR